MATGRSPVEKFFVTLQTIKKLTENGTGRGDSRGIQECLQADPVDGRSERERTREIPPLAMGEDSGRGHGFDCSNCVRMGRAERGAQGCLHRPGDDEVHGAEHVYASVQRGAGAAIAEANKSVGAYGRYIGTTRVVA